MTDLDALAAAAAYLRSLNRHDSLPYADVLAARLDAAIKERDRLRTVALSMWAEAHVFGPDHDRRPIDECRYEPCREARAALHAEAGETRR